MSAAHRTELGFPIQDNTRMPQGVYPEFGFPIQDNTRMPQGVSPVTPPFQAWINQPSQGMLPNYALLAQQNYAQGQNNIPTTNLKSYYNR